MLGDPGSFLTLIIGGSVLRCLLEIKGQYGFDGGIDGGIHAGIHAGNLRVG
jgi:hypothetical protein